VNEKVKRRTRVISIFPSDVAIVRLVGAVLLKQNEHWQIVGRRTFTAVSMAVTPVLVALQWRPRW
jgi:transposase-like protein